jgi:hypothetical protein
MQRLLRIVDVAQFLVAGFAGPYRVVAYKTRTFGNVAQGFATWAGLVFAFMNSSIPWDDSDSTQFGFAVGSWVLLAGLAYFQMFTKWCSIRPPRDEGIGHCWAGRVEPVVAVAICVLASALWDNGTFFFVGYGCSLIQVRLARLRRRLAGWTSDDTERVMAPIRAGMAWFIETTPVFAEFARAKLRLLIPGLAMVAGAVMAFFRGRTAVAAASPGVPAGVKQPTFMSRVFSHVVGSLIISAIGGTVILKVFGLILAIPLWFLGWHVSAPEPVKEEGRRFLGRAREAFEDKKEAGRAERAVEREKRGRCRSDRTQETAVAVELFLQINARGISNESIFRVTRGQGHGRRLHRRAALRLAARLFVDLGRVNARLGRIATEGCFPGDRT